MSDHLPPPAPGAAASLPASVRAFLDAPRFAVVATHDPDGVPHQAVAWYRLLEDGIVLNSAAGRRWPENLRRDPRVAVAIADGYDWVGLRGIVEMIEDQDRAQADIAEMARRYHADDPEKAERLIADQFRRQRRISFLLRPASIHAEIEGA